MLSKLFDLQTKYGINLFITSRFISTITEKFQHDLTVEIRAHKQDVQRYVEGRIPDLPSFVGRKPDLQVELKLR